MEDCSWRGLSDADREEDEEDAQKKSGQAVWGGTTGVERRGARGECPVAERRVSSEASQSSDTE